MTSHDAVILTVTPRKGTSFADAARVAIELAKSAIQDVELMTEDSPLAERLVVNRDDTVGTVERRRKDHTRLPAR